MKLKIRFPFVCYWAIGLLFFVSGAFLLFAQSFMKGKIIELTRLVNGTQGFDNWLNPKAPLTMNFYFFNITNLQQFLDGGTPNVVEVGPYVYRDSRDRRVEYTRDGVIGIRDAKFYHFDSSNGLSEDDLLTSLNLPMMIIARMLDERLPPWLVEGVALLLEGQPLMLRLSVKQLLWGYNASLFETINRELHKLHLPPIDFPQFGLFSQQGANGSYGDLLEILDGRVGVEEVGRVSRWNAKSKLPFWSGDYCNDIRGTDGSLFHPFITPSLNLSIFSTDICRSLDMQYIESTPVHSIATHLFSIDPQAFLSFNSIPSNECFCVPNKLKCLKSGVMDVSACKNGAPIVVSLPHFLHADEQYTRDVTGTRPSILHHRTNLFIEPNTGIVLKAQKRLQINFLLENYPLFKASQHIKAPIVYPVLWLEEAGSIGSDDAAQFHSQVTSKVNLLNALIGAMVAIGICACVAMLVQGGFGFVRLVLM